MSNMSVSRVACVIEGVFPERNVKVLDAAANKVVDVFANATVMTGSVPGGCIISVELVAPNDLDSIQQYTTRAKAILVESLGEPPLGWGKTRVRGLVDVNAAPFR